MPRAYPVIVLVVAITAALLAGCGGGDENDAGPPAVVSVGSVPEIGPVLVTGKGITLYAFDKDKGDESACYTFCADDCPPLLTDGEPLAEEGAIASKLGTTERRDGTTQVTYAGHPLYTWSEEKPGQRRGWGVEAFEGKWYPLKPSGETVPNPKL